MKVILVYLFSFVVFLNACGKDEKNDARLPPKIEPKPLPPIDNEGSDNGQSNPFPFPIPFPLPGSGGIPEICKISPFPLPQCPKPLPSPNPAGGSGNPNPSDSDLKGLLEEVNAARAKRGLSAIAIDPKLSCAAQKHSLDIGAKRICGHTGSDGSSPWSRAASCGTSANGEIVACGQGDAKAAVQAWTFSPGHAAIMFDPNQKFMGGGLSNNYWTVIFRR